MNCVLDLKMKKMNAVTRNAANSIIKGVNASLEITDDGYKFFTDNPDDMGIVFVRVIGSLELRAYLDKAYTTFPDEGTIECTKNIMVEP